MEIFMTKGENDKRRLLTLDTMCCRTVHEMTDVHSDVLSL